MTTVTFQGNSVNLKGEVPKVGDMAPDFTFVKTDLSEENFLKSGKKIKVLIGVPSLDTGVCETETKKFNEKLANMEDVSGIVISMDLPFAMNRFYENAGTKNLVFGSDFRSREFVTNYNTQLLDSPLAGLSARVVFVVDGQNKIIYSELVSEITEEPNYDKVLEVIKSQI